jgi:pantoate kinase
VSAVHALLVCLGWERVANWLVGAGSERHVIAVICGSGIGDVLIELWFLIFGWIPFVSSVVSAGFPFVVKVEALPPLWRGSVVFGEAQCGICCHVLGVSWVEHWILYIGG